LGAATPELDALAGEVGGNTKGLIKSRLLGGNLAVGHILVFNLPVPDRD